MSPDHIWTLVVQAVSAHVLANADALRNSFTRDTDRVVVTIQRDNLVVGHSTAEEWSDVVKDFEHELSQRIIGASEYTPTFSTTGSIEHTVHVIGLMNTASSYYSYGVNTMCGFPSITLDGTVDDWQSVRSRTIAVCNQTRMTEWRDQVVPLMDRFVELATVKIGTDDMREFWSDMFKYHNQSGGDAVSGWIMTFIPQAKACPSYHSSDLTSPISELPTGAVCVPFTWRLTTVEMPMLFCAGFSTAGYLNGAVTPTLAWAVAYDIKMESRGEDELHRSHDATMAILREQYPNN